MPDLKTSDPLHITRVQQDDMGWFTILTDGDPPKLKTKQEEPGRLAGALKKSGELVRLKYTERNDKPNPNGGFYHDYYFSTGEVVPASENGSGDDDGITRVKSTRPETAPEEAWRIALSVGTERAVQLAPHLRSEVDWPLIWALSYEIAARIYLTPPPKAADLEPLPTGGGYSDPTEPPGDPDDIPF
jgi:hypothetical protein